MDLSDDNVQTAAKLLPALAPVAKTLMNSRMQMNALERKKEAELDIVEAKQNVSQRPLQFSTTSQQMPEQQVVQQPAGAFDDSIDEMIADEDCDICTRLLAGIKDVADTERAVALSEYGRFKQAVDDTEDVSAIRDQVADMPVLERIMRREFNMIPSE